MDDKDLYAGLIRLHILHHAVKKGEVYGLWMIEELGRHGYSLSAGTLYPILHGLERKGYLRSAGERVGSRTRRVYHATPDGVAALRTAKARVWELFGELFEPRAGSRSTPHQRQPNVGRTKARSASTGPSAKQRTRKHRP